eukprot:1160513-Pelagomonas_calceolata.AAC.11
MSTESLELSSEVSTLSETVPVRYLTTFLFFKSNLRSRPEGVADLLVCKLTGWVVGFYVGSGDWGSGLYGIVALPAIVMVAGSISRAKLKLFVHVYFKFVVQVGEGVDWESKGAVQTISLSFASTGVSPLIAYYARVVFDFVEMDRVWEVP